MKEVIVQKKLPNGINIILAPNSATKAVTALVLFGTGSRYEPDPLAGISHFLEHMYFKGTKRRPSALKVSEELDSMGSSYNAFTGKEYTGYFIKAASKYTEKICDILSDMLFYPLFKPEEITKEKGAVIQEINMYEDSPRDYVDDLYELNVFGERHPLGRLIAGTREKVKSINREDLLVYLKTHYFGGNATIVISGEINDPDKTIRLVKRYFGRMPKGKTVKPEAFVKPKENHPLIQFKQTEQTHMIIGALGYPYGHKNSDPYKLLSVILGGGMSSRLFIKIRERRGLAYYVRTGISDYLDAGTIGTQSGVENNKVYEAIKVIVNEYRTIHKNLMEKEIKKAKEIVKGKWVLDYEDSMNVAMKMGMDARYGVVLKTLEQRMAEIDRVELAEVKNVAKQVFSGNLALALIGPFQDSDKFDKLLVK